MTPKIVIWGKIQSGIWHCNALWEINPNVLENTLWRQIFGRCTDTLLQIYVPSYTVWSHYWDGFQTLLNLCMCSKCCATYHCWNTFCNFHSTSLGQISFSYCLCSSLFKFPLLRRSHHFICHIISYVTPFHMSLYATCLINGCVLHLSNTCI